MLQQWDCELFICVINDYLSLSITDMCVFGYTGNLLQSMMGGDEDEDSMQKSTPSAGPTPQSCPPPSATLTPVELA